MSILLCDDSLHEIIDSTYLILTKPQKLISAFISIKKQLTSYYVESIFNLDEHNKLNINLDSYGLCYSDLVDKAFYSNFKDYENCK